MAISTARLGPVLSVTLHSAIFVYVLGGWWFLCMF